MNQSTIALIRLRRAALQTAVVIVALTIIGLARDADQQARRADRAEVMASRLQEQLDRDDAQAGMESLDRQSIHDLDLGDETVYGNKLPMLPVAPPTLVR